MKKERLFSIFGIILIIVIGFLIFLTSPKKQKEESTKNEYSDTVVKEEEKEREKHPMAIESLRNGKYPGGDFIIEEKLSNRTNYEQFIVSYKSEGLKIYGLLTVPLGQKPEKGFPAIIFIHGYIQPEKYSTTGNYATYQARLANEGFITFKPDLRGHGNSEGEAVGTHFSEKYVIDALYAISYLKNYPKVNPSKIGYWGHSNGGSIGLRAITVSPDIKVASFWAGVVGSYEDMLETYNEKISFLRNAKNSNLVIENKLPSENPDFWNKLDPYFYLTDIQTSIQLQHGTKDDSVPIELSLSLKEKLEKLNKPIEYYEYAGDDHNLSKNVTLAFQRTIDFFNENLADKNDSLHEPIADASKRVTKKPFGIKISPNDSPVQPERFSGYHIGVDFEIFTEEENSEINISAICAGPLIAKRQATGYGGIAIQECDIDNEPATIIYGHLKLSSITKNLNENMSSGEKIGILGQGFSEETDGERKHLHLGIHRGNDINLLGYVQNQKDLSDWIDYQSLLDK